MDLKWKNRRAWTRFIWFRIGILQTQYWTSGLHEMQWIPLVTEQLLACQGLLHGGKEFVSLFVNLLVSVWPVHSEDVNWRVYYKSSYVPIVVLRAMNPCSLVSAYLHFREHATFFRVQVWRKQVPPKCQHPLYKTQHNSKITIWTITSMKSLKTCIFMIRYCPAFGWRDMNYIIIDQDREQLQCFANNSYRCLVQ
jgi:hypothetical protein